jgi:hypothetical protein
MSNSEAPTAPMADKPGTPAPAKVLHRVCIQCNNVFRVPPEKFDAKQCPNCHKG